MIDRREALRRLCGVVGAAVLPRCVRGDDAEPAPATHMGLVTYCCRFRREQQRRLDSAHDLFEPFTFLEHCRSLGAGGMQISLGDLSSEAAEQLRRRADGAGMYVEAIVSLPSDRQEVPRFDAEMQTAARAGADAVRTVIFPGRRYERFHSLEEFREYEARGRRMLELATPIAEKHRVPLAVENHKNHRNAERVALFEQIDSEYVGACIDTGNSVSLLEDAIETAEALAPWAHAVHLKDQAVQLYDDGFLLADIPLGQGALRLQRIVEVIRASKPDINFTLELITRDPLNVPCLTEGYWATFPDLPGRDLARTLRMVRERATDNLQDVSSLSRDEQVALEDANVRSCLDYARDVLHL